jgi:hypothetical protein
MADTEALVGNQEEGGSAHVTGGMYGYWCWWGVSTTLFKAKTRGARNWGLVYAAVHVLSYLAVVGMNGVMAFDFAANDAAQDMAAAAFGTSLASLLIVVGIALTHAMSSQKPDNKAKHQAKKEPMVYSPVMLSAIMAGSRASIVFDFLAYSKIGVVATAAAAADKIQAFQLFVIATITLKFYLAAIMTNNLRFLGDSFKP